MTNTERFAAWFVVSGDATADERRVVWSVLGAISCHQLPSQRARAVKSGRTSFPCSTTSLFKNRFQLLHVRGSQMPSPRPWKMVGCLYSRGRVILVAESSATYGVISGPGSAGSVAAAIVNSCRTFLSSPVLTGQVYGLPPSIQSCLSLCRGRSCSRSRRGKSPRNVLNPTPETLDPEPPGP